MGGRRCKPEESPGIKGAEWFLTGTGGNPRESATENIPPRVMRGKGEKVRQELTSARVTGRLGKPHSMQGQRGCC